MLGQGVFCLLFEYHSDAFFQSGGVYHTHGVGHKIAVCVHKVGGRQRADPCKTRSVVGNHRYRTLYSRLVQAEADCKGLLCEGQLHWLRKVCKAVSSQ